MACLWGLVSTYNVPVRLLLAVVEGSGGSGVAPGCCSDCIISATAAIAVGLAANPVTMACTSSGLRLTVVWVATVDAGTSLDVDGTTFPLEEEDSISYFPVKLKRSITRSLDGAFSITRLLNIELP